MHSTFILNDSFLKSYNRYLQEICQCCGPSPPVMEWWQQWHLCSVLGGREPPLPVGGRGLETGNSLASATAQSNNSFLKIFIYAWHEIHNFIWKQFQSFAWLLVNQSIDLITPQSFVWSIIQINIVSELPQSNHLCNIRVDSPEVIRLDIVLN